MKSKIGIVVFSIILFFGFAILVMKKTNKIEVEKEVDEYVPAEEISDEQERNTVVTLYYYSDESGVLAPEARKIDVKRLMNNPYTLILEMLFEGPTSNNYTNLFPENTRVINTCMEDDVLIIDLSKDFLEIQKKSIEDQRLILDSILKTMCQLKEVNGIRILIEGESNVMLENCGIILSDKKMIKKEA